MQVVLDLPDVNIKKEELKILLAIKLFEEGIVSLEKAAEIVGYSEQTFSKILLKKGISPIKYDDLNLKEEFANA
jgi:predicted HTH domain antitoxin